MTTISTLIDAPARQARGGATFARRHALEGGAKAICRGRFGGLGGIEAWIDLRCIARQTLARDYPF